MELQIFKNEQFGEVRTATINNQIYFNLNDCCQILDLSNPRKTIERLNKDGVTTSDIIDSLGRTQQANFINEANFYKLVFQSRKPEAEKFADWVTSEVLPSIRKHGLYATDQLLNDPDLAIAAFQALKEERARKQALEAQMEADKPKVLFANAVSASQTSILIGDFAKLLRQNGLDIGQNRLFIWLRENGFLINRKGDSWNMPTQRSMDRGLFEIKERTHHEPNGTIRISKTTKITGKGQVYFMEKLLAEVA